MFLEGLLGGLGGLTDAYSNIVQQKQARSLKTDDDKQKFQQDVLKGIILQQMRPKGGDFNWEDLVSDGSGISNMIDPAFLEKIASGMKKKPGKGGTKNPGFSPFGAPAPKPALSSPTGIKPSVY